MTRAAAIACCIAFSMLAAVPAAAQSAEQSTERSDETSRRLDALFGEHQPYQAFLVTLQAAVAADDRQAVATMIAYPLETRIAGARVTLTSATDLVRRYDQLFTPTVVAAIERQTYATLFATAEGVMIGDGEIWYGAVCADPACAAPRVGIIAINSSEVGSEQ